MEEVTFLLKSANSSIRWLFVSQPATEISMGFEECPEYSFTKVKIQTSVVDEDIRWYVRRRLETDARLRSFPPSVKSKIIQVMDEKSSGM